MHARARREASIAEYEASLECLPGDVVVASCFMSYAGPFPSEYRDDLVRSTWLPQVRQRPGPPGCCQCARTRTTALKSAWLLQWVRLTLLLEE